MKRFFALCLALTMATVFFAGCEKKKAEVKDVQTTTTPDGTTTETDTHKVETNVK